MLPALLNMIARRVFYEDYFSSAGVCKSWLSAGDDYTNGPPSRFPSLLLAEKKKDGREFRELFILYACQNHMVRYVVVVLWGSFDEMGFCRPGDSKWTTVGCSSLTCDITYYNKKVYTFDKDYRIGACDVHGDDPKTLVDVSSLTANLYDHYMQGLTWGALIVGLDEGHKKRLLVLDDITVVCGLRVHWFLGKFTLLTKITISKHVMFMGMIQRRCSDIRQLLVNQNQSTSLWRPHVWQDVKKHVVTKPSDTSAAKNSTVDQEPSNTAMEHKCSVNGGDSSVYEEASKVESCPSVIILDDLLALDSIVRFDFE
nr:hypothetical protein [Tanacetum cinerariifolium]